MDIVVEQADYASKKHQIEIPALLEAYAKDPMGGGKALEDHAKQHLVEELSKRSYAFSVIAYVNGEPAGLANCFEAFSTFACRPLVNIHDIAVLARHRGMGISQRLLEKVEEIAMDRGCCKLTLEVLENNRIAKNAYRKFGFNPYELDPKAGAAQFLEKKLPR